ncbi:MAG: hypothetical protein US42_C0005G0029 [Candidatus Magasanikbacteria bacterium GW2011_GWC2_37_14]|uniref:Uncharacterized protein n=1 Tax=Candidatus Magasanikbacteria bacterium GW2011_GWC2_37_14 TaxID=1619046 RepID=A0A0G0IUG5_9BACT|nr:MAG: hypothetical protein US42_C0005G0029 [Candidatus Magasanikbacteria bacterium GW2011_GWC2_37_14]
MKFFRKLKSIKLSKKEKQNFRIVLSNLIMNSAGLSGVAERRPVRNYYNLRHNNQKVPFLHLILKHNYMIAGLLIAAILAMGGGTAVAAENSVPGDLLYRIKTQVNEEVRSALAISPEAQAAWDAKRAERRLEETEKLAGENKLTTSTSEMLASKFAEFSQKATDRLQKLEDAGKLTPEQVQNLKANFEVAVKAHDEILSRIEEKKQNRGEMKAVMDSLRGQASTTIKDRLEHDLKLIEEGTSSTLSKVSENRKNAAQNKISEVQKFIDNNDDKVSSENKAEAVKKLAEATTLVTEGDKLVIEQKFGEAIMKYSEAHRKAQEAQMYLTTRFRLERRMESTSSTPAVFASGTLQFNNEKRQEIWDTHEGFKNMEEKLKEEVKQARETFKEVKQQEMEKIKEAIKANRPPKPEDKVENEVENEDDNGSSTTSTNQ